MAKKKNTKVQAPTEPKTDLNESDLTKEQAFEQVSDSESSEEPELNQDSDTEQSEQSEQSSEQPELNENPNEEAEHDRTHVVILSTSLGDSELGAFSPGDEYPCNEATANRLIERNMAKEK